MRIESIIRPLSQGHRLLDANRIASLQCSNTYLSIYFHPDRFRHGRSGHRLLTNMHILKKNLNANPLSENNTYLVSRVTSCNILTEVKAVPGKMSKLQSKNIILQKHPFFFKHLSEIEKREIGFIYERILFGQS